MQDRVPTYPGRVRLIPVPGQDGLYDIERADAPVVDGTPINKATLLTDATAALLSLTGNPTVNDALEKLGERAGYEIGSYVGTGSKGQQNPCSITFSKAPKIVIIIPDDSSFLTALIIYWGAQIATGFFGNAAGGYNNACAWQRLSFSGKTVSWYYSGSVTDGTVQYNGAGKTYHYVALW